jgi:hypothetical protein
MMNIQASLSQPSSSERSEHARQIDSVAWSVFFIWVGLSMLMPIPWGWFLLGVAAIISAVQFARWQMAMTIEGFWIACGAVCLVGGLWSILALPWPLAPILLILLGVALLGKAVVGR